MTSNTQIVVNQLVKLMANAKQFKVMKIRNQENRTSSAKRPAPFSRRLADFTGTDLTSGLRRFPARCLSRLSELKQRLSAQLAAEYGDSIHPVLLRQAINEADSIAATTPFPGLFLPSLAEEKVRFAHAWSLRQRAIRERTHSFAA